MSPAPAGASAPPVPPPIAGPDGTCYYFSGIEEFETWPDAVTACEAMGGYLTDITTQEELEFVAGHLNFNGHDRVWIGLNDVDTEMTFVWQDGSALTWADAPWYGAEANVGLAVLLVMLTAFAWPAR